MSNSLSQSLARALNVSQESVDVDINIGNDAVVDDDGAVISPLAPATDEPIIEAQETELQEEEGGIEDTGSEIDEVESDIETLESIQIQLHKSVDAGGLDTVSYEMFNITMDHIYRKHGITAATVFPSMEAFGEDRVGQTQISMERVGSSLATFKKGAANLIKQLWFRIKSFVANVIKLNFSLEKRVAAVDKKAGTTKNDPKAKDVKLYAAKRLHIGGKVPTSNVIVSTYGDMTLGFAPIQEAMDEYFAAAGVANELELNADGEDNSKLGQYIQALDLKAQAQAKLADRMKFQDAKLVVKEFGRGEGKSMIKGVKLETSEAPSLDDAQVAPLTIDQIRGVCKNILINIKTLKAMNATYTNKKLEKEITQEEGAKPKSNKAVKQAIKEAMQTHSRIISYSNSINKGMLDYCVQSLQSHIAAGKGGEEAKPEAAAE